MAEYTDITAEGIKAHRVLMTSQSCPDPVALMDVDHTAPTLEGVKAHRRMMPGRRDSGACIALCGRQRASLIIFCDECNKAWENELPPGDPERWAVMRRTENVMVVWPEWT